MFIPRAIQNELISPHHNNLLAGYFSIQKTCELLAKKYNWPILQHDVEVYVKGWDACLVFKAVYHKLYNDLQSLAVPTHQWTDLFVDLVTDLPILIDWKRDSYDSILIIVDQLRKMVHYKLVKITIYVSRLIEVIINMVIYHYSHSDSIMTNRSLFFTSKFWSLLCYLPGIKR